MFGLGRIHIHPSVRPSVRRSVNHQSFVFAFGRTLGVLARAWVIIAVAVVVVTVTVVVIT